MASPSGPLDALTKLVTLLSLAVALFAAWKALPLDGEIKRLQTETQRLDLALKQADAELRVQESSRKVTLELYQEVKRVIEKKDKDPREEEAVRVLVESLADDPFRWKLLQVIAVAASSAEVKQAAAEASEYHRGNAQLSPATTPAPPAAPPPAPAAAGRGGTLAGAFNVDVFYCAGTQAASEPVARAVWAMKGPQDTGRWRLRPLPESINEQPGYGLRRNTIRFTPPDERPVAQAIAKALSDQGVPVDLQETPYATPGYVSVFICG